MKTFALIAVAGLASVASAQTATVNLTHDDADGIINVGDTVTWTFSISHTGFAVGSVPGGGNMSINGNNALGTSSVMTYVDNGNAIVGVGANGGYNGGSSNGAGIGFVSWTNSLFIEAFSGILADHSNPYVVGSFTFTASAEGTLDYTIGLGLAASAFLGMDTSAFSTTNLTSEQVARNVQSLTIVPTPASAALLGLGGLVATRRRR